MNRALGAVGVGLLAVLLGAWPYIDLQLAAPIGGWAFNAPVADLAAMALAPIGALLLLRAGCPAAARAPLLAALLGYGMLLAAGLASGVLSPERSAALHEWVRKPLFFGLVYGVGLTGFVLAAGRDEAVRRLLLAAVALCTAISLATSVGRILAGDTLWFQAVSGLTNNHKTLAVALAPALPLLWGWRAEPPGRWTRVVVAMGALALLFSMSRTAWISAVVAAAFFVQWRGRPLAAFRATVPVILVLGVLGATYGPLLTGSLAQLDALRSRHSLDKRSWALFSEAPLVGAGPGASVRVEVPTFPDYRVNGVDAHGVVQKVGAEYGLVGLAGMAAAVAALGSALRRRHTLGSGVWPAFLALHANLLLSTETFSQTHWAILALVVGGGLREGREPPP